MAEFSRFVERHDPRLVFRGSIQTRKDICAGVAARWKEQYCNADGTWRTTMSGDTQPTYEALRTLDPETATVEIIAKIIGNDSWTRGDCTACGEPEFPVVLFEAFSEYGGETKETRICARCLRSGAELLADFSKGTLRSGHVHKEEGT